MGLALRILGMFLFVAAVGAATWGAYEAFPPGDAFTSVELSTGAEEPTAVLAGTPTPVTIQAKNPGTAPVSFTVRAADEGASFQMEQGSVSLSPNASTTVRGTLTAPADLEGDGTVRLEAVDNATARRVGLLRLPVSASPPLAGEVELQPTTPAVVPGGTTTIQVTVRNPAVAAQTFTLTVEGAEGSVSPESLQVPGNQSRPATLEVTVPEDASGSFEVGLTATNAAGRSDGGAAAFQVVPPGEVRVFPFLTAFEVAPGHNYTVPAILISAVDGTHPVTVETPGMLETTFDGVSHGDVTGGFITLTAPGELTGETVVTLNLQVGPVDGALDITLTPASGPQAADQGQAQVNYIGRLANGQVFDTSFEEIMVGPYPKAETFQARPDPQPFPLQLGQQGGAIEGFKAAVNGMAPGETQTVHIPPALAYGPARVHQNVSATTELPRENTERRVLEGLPRDRLPASFDLDNKEVGDVVTFEAPQGDGSSATFRFRITEMDAQRVSLQRLVEEGETVPLYPMWPEATEVVTVNETTIVFRTTPPEDAGSFAWDLDPQSHQAQWGPTTSIVSVNETTILLRHAPEEGTTYQMASRPGAPPQAWTIEAVGDDDVHVSSPNPHPLGGRTLVFDVYLVSLDPEAEPRSGFPGGS